MPNVVHEPVPWYKREPLTKTYYDEQGQRCVVKVLTKKRARRCQHDYRPRALDQVEKNGWTRVCRKCGNSIR
jgi:hypothetical protein